MENKKYDILKHFRDSMDYIKSFSSLKEALEYCRDELESRELDNYGNGHAISVFSEHGSIYEVNYHGSEEINICGRATVEELKIIEDFRKAVFDLIQLMDIEQYGCCCQVKDCGQGIVYKLYEMDCKSYIIKYVDGDSVGFIRVTTCRK